MLPETPPVSNETSRMDMSASLSEPHVARRKKENDDRLGWLSEYLHSRRYTK
jgi:hypothetical protein